MTLKLIDEEFLKEFSGLVHEYNDRLLADDSLSDSAVLLLCVYLIENKNKKSGAKYEEAKQLFISLGRKDDPNFRVAIHNARGKSLIDCKGKTISLLIKGLKEVRRVLGQVEKSPVHIIKSGQNFTAIKLFEEFLLSEIKSHEILLCDSYISYSTLFPFSALKGKITLLKILTSNVYDSDKFDEYKKKMGKEMGITIEVKNSKKIHERFMICGDKCWSIGSSIKDLGNKDAVIREISEVTNSMKDLFSDRWNEA